MMAKDAQVPLDEAPEVNETPEEKLPEVPKGVVRSFTPEGDPLLGADAHMDRPAIDAAEMRKRITGEKIKAMDLVGKTFRIKTARQFPTSYDNQPINPWFVVGVLEDTGELFNTVLGGQAVAQELQAWALSEERGSPLLVELEFHAGKGRQEGYYTFK